MFGSRLLWNVFSVILYPVCWICLFSATGNIHPFVQAVVLIHFLRVEKSRSNKPPDDASLDGGTLGQAFPVDNFPDDRLPYVGLPEIGLQDHLRQGKVAELRQELNSGGKKDKNHSAKKITLKKIVANMTMSNNDMVALFPDIVDCMQIPSLEIKKMYVPRSGVGVKAD
jgi:hypothetical protein